MGITKSELFTKHQNDVANLARVLAHPARIAILQHIGSQQTCINTDLVQELGLAQATISQHLRELKEAGLIQGSVEGVRLNYCINSFALNKARLILENFFFEIKSAANGDCC